MVTYRKTLLISAGGLIRCQGAGAIERIKRTEGKDKIEYEIKYKQDDMKT